MMQSPEHSSPLLPLDVLAENAGFDHPDTIFSAEPSPESSNGMAPINIQLTDTLLWPRSNEERDAKINRPGTNPGYKLQEPIDVDDMRVYGYIPKTRTFVFSPHDNPFDTGNFCTSFRVKKGLVGPRKALQTKLFVDGKEVADDPIDAAVTKISIFVQDKTRPMIDRARSFVGAAKRVCEKLSGGVRDRLTLRLGSKRTEGSTGMGTQQTIETSQGVVTVIPQEASE